MRMPSLIFRIDPDRGRLFETAAWRGLVQPRPKACKPGTKLSFATFIAGAAALIVRNNALWLLPTNCLTGREHLAKVWSR